RPGTHRTRRRAAQTHPRHRPAATPRPPTGPATARHPTGRPRRRAGVPSTDPMATVATPMSTTRTDQTAPPSGTGTAATITDAVPMDDPQETIGRDTATESTDPAW